MKTKVTIILFVAFCFVLAMTTPALETPALARQNFDSLEQEVDAYVLETMERLPIPGLAVGIVRGDRVLYVQGYGTANGNGDPVTPQTPFLLASVTKSFTALAVHQLAVAGKIDLDAPVHLYVPEFRFANPQASAGITVRHLLDHTSGISTAEGSQPYLHSPKTTFEEALERLAHYSPIHPPGEQEEYSNWNYVLLGKVIARASGHSYREYMQENILKPLEMSHASFADYHMLPGVATGHLMTFGFSLPYDEKHVPVMLSAGYLTASAEEMTHYLIPFFNQGAYHGQVLLPAQGQGWYDTTWNWHAGQPGALSYGFSGGHNSINTNIQLFSRHQVGVVVLMNTRFDSLLPAPSANDIAFNIARLTIDYPYELPSSQQFYASYAALDGMFLLMIGSVVWQTGHLKIWRSRYQTAPRSKRIAAWFGIGLDLLLFFGLLSLPALAGTRWNIILYHRADFSIPLLALCVGFGILAVIKVVRSR